ncbi:hypothetical protein MASR2M70_17190 [Bacillota bacterium]
MKDFYKKSKNSLKRGRRKPEKRKSLQRTLTANRLMVVMSIMDIVLLLMGDSNYHRLGHFNFINSTVSYAQL